MERRVGELCDPRKLWWWFTFFYNFESRKETREHSWSSGGFDINPHCESHTWLAYGRWKGSSRYPRYEGKWQTGAELSRIMGMTRNMGKIVQITKSWIKNKDINQPGIFVDAFLCFCCGFHQIPPNFPGLSPPKHQVTSSIARRERGCVSAGRSQSILGVSNYIKLPISVCEASHNWFFKRFQTRCDSTSWSNGSSFCERHRSGQGLARWGSKHKPWFRIHVTCRTLCASLSVNFWVIVVTFKILGWNHRWESKSPRKTHGWSSAFRVHLKLNLFAFCDVFRSPKNKKNIQLTKKPASIVKRSTPSLWYFFWIWKLGQLWSKGCVSKSAEAVYGKMLGHKSGRFNEICGHFDPLREVRVPSVRLKKHLSFWIKQIGNSLKYKKKGQWIEKMFQSSKLKKKRSLVTNCYQHGPVRRSSSLCHQSGPLRLLAQAGWRHHGVRWSKKKKKKKKKKNSKWPADSGW